MDARKFVKCFLLIIISLCVLSAAFTFCVDPLFQYHKPWFGLKPIVFNDGYYFSSGIVKNFDYDNLIIGSSMSQNFRISWFEKNFKGITAKANISGIRPRNVFELFDICLNKPTTKNIFLNFDIAFIAEPNKYRYENFPGYLYDNNYFNDVNYLLNKDVDFKYSENLLSKNRRKQWTDFDNLFVWDRDNDVRYGKKIVYKHYIDADSNVHMNSNYYIENVNTLCKYINNNPSVNFYLFLSPYSMAFWSRQIKYHNFINWKNFLNYSFSKLTKYDNCKVFLLSDQYSLDFISNLDNYRDTEHYNAKMNKYIAKCFGNNKNLLTKDNYKVKLDEFFSYIEKYDYDSMFSDIK